MSNIEVLNEIIEFLGNYGIQAKITPDNNAEKDYGIFSFRDTIMDGHSSDYPYAHVDMNGDEWVTVVHATALKSEEDQKNFMAAVNGANTFCNAMNKLHKNAGLLK